MKEKYLHFFHYNILDTQLLLVVEQTNNGIKPQDSLSPSILYGAYSVWHAFNLDMFFLGVILELFLRAFASFA